MHWIDLIYLIGLTDSQYKLCLPLCQMIVFSNPKKE